MLLHCRKRSLCLHAAGRSGVQVRCGEEISPAVNKLVTTPVLPVTMDIIFGALHESFDNANLTFPTAEFQIKSS